MAIKKCIGCGLTLQYDNENELGYIPKEKYDNSNYCQRCFKLIHYNQKDLSDKVVNDDEIINIINKDNYYVFFLIDIFNINEETIESFKRINVNKTLIISKSDLIFNSINLNNLKKNIKEVYNIDNDIIFLSSKNKESINSIFKVLDNNNINKCYITGYTNAGKSTLINTIKDNNDITTSSILNTTLDFIEIKKDNYTIIDTPGFSYNNTFYENDDFNLIKRINTKYFVRPITYQVKKEQIFLIEDKMYIKDFDYNSITFYMSNLIKIKKIYKDENIKYKEIKIADNSDIVISSLGFINIKKACIIKVNEEYFNLISVRKSIIK